MKHLPLTTILVAIFFCTSLAAQIDPSVMDVVTYEGDTTVRVIISRSGYERISSRAMVEWWTEEEHGDDTPSTRKLLAQTPVRCLEAGWQIATGPFFEMRNGRLSCVVECTHNGLLHPPHERMRIDIGAAGKLECNVLDDSALIAAQCFMKPHASPKPRRDTIGEHGRYVVEMHLDGNVAESPWVTVRDAKHNNDELLRSSGILVGYSESGNFDGGISIALFEYQCCAGTKSYFEQYQIDPEAKQARLVSRTLFMYGLESPHSLHRVADSITTTSTMRLFLNTHGTKPNSDDYADDELRAWKHGIALAPNTKAWIVATRETDEDMWAFVIGRPALTPEVRKLIERDNSSEAGTVAGWMMVRENSE
ncbi:MAG TPA: hypothetical protein VK147_02870 [Candidatus Didemnitutus sp.]|nr:hypothetical protein [Candidatus Didemnitutus sp.]